MRNCPSKTATLSPLSGLLGLRHWGQRLALRWDSTPNPHSYRQRKMERTPLGSEGTGLSQVAPNPQLPAAPPGALFLIRGLQPPPAPVKRASLRLMHCTPPGWEARGYFFP